jgi:hypothetical protein
LAARELTGKTAGKMSQQDCDEPSNNTNPFTDSQFEANDAAWQRDMQGLTLASCTTAQRNPHPSSMRIILKPVTSAVYVRLAALGIAGTSPEGLVVLEPNLDGNREALRELVITQSSTDIGFKINATPKDAGNREWDKMFSCLLYYMPAEDSVIVISIDSGGATMKAQPDEQLTEPAVQLQSHTATVVQPGSWAIFSASEEHLMNVVVLTRRSSTILEDDGSGQDHAQPRASKRAIPSHILPSSKKSKHIGETKSSAASLLQVVQLSSTAKSLVKPEAMANSLLMAHHPLEHLADGQTVSVSGPRGAEYRLTRLGEIKSQNNSLVFKAVHSHLSEGLVVAKVLRPPKPSSANQALNIAELWVKEVKNHSKLNHVSIDSSCRIGNLTHIRKLLCVFSIQTRVSGPYTWSM